VGDVKIASAKVAKSKLQARVIVTGTYVEPPPPDPDPEPPPPPPPSNLLYPPDTTLTHPAVNSDARPPYLGSIIDSTWKTKITRITQNHLWRNNYSTHQSWNLDGSRIMFPGYGGRILDGNTYADLGPMAAWSDFPCWSNLHADYAYGVKFGDNRIRRYSVSANAWTTIATLSEYDQLDLGGYSGIISDNDRVALIYRKGTAYGVVVYDLENKAVLSTLAVTGGSPTETSMSRSGEYVIVHHASVPGSGTFQGSKVYKASDMSLVRHMTNGGPHSDKGRDANGDDIFVFISDDTDAEGCCIVRSHRLKDGVEISLLPYGQSIYGIGHISCGNFNRPGWAYLSCNNVSLTNWNGFGQVVAVKTDGSGTVEVFGFTHSTADPGTYYDAAPLASCDRDGRRMIFGSNWGGNPSSEVYCFVAEATSGQIKP
jgi:hypothetical protein